MSQQTLLWYVQPPLMHTCTGRPGCKWPIWRKPGFSETPLHCFLPPFILLMVYREFRSQYKQTTPIWLVCCITHCICWSPASLTLFLLVPYNTQHVFYKRHLNRTFYQRPYIIVFFYQFSEAVWTFQTIVAASSLDVTCALMASWW